MITPRSHQQRTIMLAMLGTGLLVFAGKWAEGNYGYAAKKGGTELTALVVVGVTLAFLADAAPQIGAPLSLLVLLAALYRYAPEISSALKHQQKPQHRKKGKR